MSEQTAPKPRNFQVLQVSKGRERQILSFQRLRNPHLERLSRISDLIWYFHSPVARTHPWQPGTPVPVSSGATTAPIPSGNCHGPCKPSRRSVPATFPLQPLRFSGAPPGLRSPHFVRSHQAFGQLHITRPPCGFSSPMYLGKQTTPPGNSP